MSGQRDPDFPIALEDVKDLRTELVTKLQAAFPATTHADWAPMINGALDRAEDGDLDGVRDFQEFCLLMHSALQRMLDHSAEAEAAGKAAPDA